MAARLRQGQPLQPVHIEHGKQWERVFGYRVEAEFSRCRIEYGAQGVDIELPGTGDSATFQFAEMVGVEYGTVAFDAIQQERRGYLGSRSAEMLFAPRAK